jgi:orotate phosphoribosyltransferase
MIGQTPTTYLSCAAYLDETLQSNKRKNLIRESVAIIKRYFANLDKKYKPTAIACSGVSGLLIAPAIADALGLDLIVVRKNDDEGTHSSCRVEGVACDNYLIVDDFVSTGATVKHIMGEIYNKLCKYSECVGVYSYHRNRRKIEITSEKLEEIRSEIGIPLDYSGDHRIIV